MISNKVRLLSRIQFDILINRLWLHYDNKFDTNIFIPKNILSSNPSLKQSLQANWSKIMANYQFKYSFIYARRINYLFHTKQQKTKITFTLQKSQKQKLSIKSNFKKANQKLCQNIQPLMHLNLLKDSLLKFCPPCFKANYSTSVWYRAMREKPKDLNGIMLGISFHSQLIF